jgi:hypothetical protein
MGRDKNGRDLFFTPGLFASGGTKDIPPNTIMYDSDLDKLAWYVGSKYGDHGGDHRKKTQRAGLKAPNALGMYDMSGNVREWCFDGQGDYRIIKGGCYEDLNLLKVGRLFKTSAYTLDRGLGFRLARTQH